MQTEVINGFFDVRKYEKNVEHKNRKLLSDGDNFTFNASFALDELPEQFKQGDQPDEFVRVYASRTELQNAEHEGRQAVADRAAVKFKIGSSTKWFDKCGRECAKPHNEYLDGSQFEVRIDYRRKARKADDDKSACGYWVNAIMFRIKDANPFAGNAFEEAPADAQAEPEQDGDGEQVKLPFDM